VRPERAYSPAASASHAPVSHAPASHALDPSRVLVIGCGALARELVAVIDQAGLANVDLTCLPATLHNRPGGIPAAVRAKIRAAGPRYERIFIAYADCGTGGLLDNVLRDEGVERLPGAHCYEFYSGSAAFEAMTDEDPATFFLTDFLACNFDRLVIKGLGLDRHPELLPTYFGNYHRLVYLAQTDDPALAAAARRAARWLGLAYELRRTGYGSLATSVVAAATAGVRPRPVVAVAADDALAARASNAARRATVGAKSTDSLPSVQTLAPNPRRRARISRPMQEDGGSRGGAGRSFRPPQGRTGTLQGLQGTARTATATPPMPRSPA
jgi:hypothetical protein